MSRSRRGVLVVFAKAPEAGRVKTRLVPPFSPEQAAGLYACLLGDVLEESARAARALDLELVLSAEPPEAMAALAAAAPRGLRVVAQRGPDLASRMRWALAEAAAAGSAPILLRGSDSPTLDVELFRTALARLEAADLVICPDRDGGYSLVAMRRAHPGLFQHPMSTPSVLEDTLAEARRLGLRAECVEARFDVDCAVDLSWLAQARAQQPELPCPRTLAFLDANGLWEQGGRLESRPTRSEAEPSEVPEPECER